MTEQKLRMLACATLVAFAAVAAAGCGSSGEAGESSYGGEVPDYESALAGAPAPLAALHEQANELLPGGVDAFRERLAGLEGYPVVVNKWASWCGPCRYEFPFFQAAAARFGKRVAFLGVDSDDSEDAAATFLESYPVPYPSFSDPDQKIAAEFNATAGFPSTAFYDASGELIYLKLGPYSSEEDLAADIERFALGAESSGE